jgi:hypothetical protein
MSDETRKADEPFDRLTELCAEMTAAIDRPENSDVKVIVFLNDEEHAGIQTHGYDDTMDAVTDLFIHMKAMFNASGKDLVFIPVGRIDDN